MATLKAREESFLSCVSRKRNGVEISCPTYETAYCYGRSKFIIGATGICETLFGDMARENCPCYKYPRSYVEAHYWACMNPF